MRTLATIAALATAVVLMPGAALANTQHPYDGQDPSATGCAGGNAITARTANAVVSGQVVGRIDLRYSTSCRTVWARVVAYYTPTNAVAYVVRNSDGKNFSCRNATWSSDLGGYTCYTLMLDDAGVTSYAYAYITGPSGLANDPVTGSW